jgi:hypothetical protein
MKIEKFNESVESDKIIKLYQNSSINDYYTDKNNSEKRLDDKKNNILNIIREYHELKKYYFAEKYKLYGWIIDFDFYILDNHPYFNIKSGNNQKYQLRYKDVQDLLTYMENPKLYMNMIKYNVI